MNIFQVISEKFCSLVINSVKRDEKTPSSYRNGTMDAPKFKFQVTKDKRQR